MKIKLAGLDQTLIYEKLENGLELFLIPYTNKNNYSVHYITKYGSTTTSFKLDNKLINVPDGIAHFLEHKMFEQEDGLDPFSFFAKTGTNCNASTNLKSTRYLIEGSTSLYENLDYLISYVNKPYFTDSNVEKEKGIIAEEIKMYDDDAEWQLDGFMKEGTYQVDNTRVDIAGTVASINQITKEDLYNCYNAFYQQNNMFIVATGNIDPDKIITTVKNNLDLKNNSKRIKVQLIEAKEPAKVLIPFKEVKTNILNTKLGLSIKLPWQDKYNHYLYSMYCSAILTIIFGSSSLFREQMKKNNCMTNFYFDREQTKDYITLVFAAESDKPEELAKTILDFCKTTEITEEDLARLKKVWLASEIMIADNINVTLDNLVYDLIEYGKVIPNKLEIIKSLDIDTLNEIKQGFNLDNKSIIIMRPKDNKED
ncbi:MAG: pitrilysin family protein [Bacilli bacterium]